LIRFGKGAAPSGSEAAPPATCDALATDEWLSDPFLFLDVEKDGSRVPAQKFLDARRAVGGSESMAT